LLRLAGEAAALPHLSIREHRQGFVHHGVAVAERRVPLPFDASAKAWPLSRLRSTGRRGFVAISAMSLVARMERSEIRDSGSRHTTFLEIKLICFSASSVPAPDCASLHPGYEKSASRRSRTCECIPIPVPRTSLILLASCPVRGAS
jgi:hypothetical protein